MLDKHEDVVDEYVLLISDFVMRRLHAAIWDRDRTANPNDSVLHEKVM